MLKIEHLSFSYGKKKAESRDIIIEEEVLSYIAERIDSNVRELEGALLKIIS